MQKSYECRNAHCRFHLNGICTEMNYLVCKDKVVSEPIIIEALPDGERWIVKHHDNGNTYYECPKCGHYTNCSTNYCPDCGGKRKR